MQMDNAIALRDYGFNIIVLAEKDKQPHAGAYGSGNIRTLFENPHSVDEIETLFRKFPQANVGILTSNCTVIDADCQEAVDFIEANFPPTPIVAKTAKGRHYFYAPSKIGRVTAKHVSGGEAFSIRGPGSVNYVVAPGSIHPTGVKYEWLSRGGLPIDELPSINELDAKQLKEHFDDRAIPAVASSFIPTNGGLGAFDPGAFRAPGESVGIGARNNSLASDVGTWISQGIDEDESLKLAIAANADNDPPLSRREVEHTHGSVWRTHLRNHPEAEPIEPTTEPLKPYVANKAHTSELTDTQLRPPGVLGVFFDWHLRTAWYPNQRLAAQSALAFGSTVLGRRYVTDQDNWPSLYFLTIGKTTTGKKHGVETIECALEEAGFSELLGGRGYTSPGAILSGLRDKPNHLTIIDEFGDYLEACNAKGNSHRKEAMSVLNEVFSCGNGTLRPMVYSSMTQTEKQKQDAQATHIKSPAITMYLMTQPEKFYGVIGEGEIANGFLGRMLVMDMEAKRRPPAHKRSLPSPPAELLDWAKNARGRNVSGLGAKMQDLFDVRPSPHTVEIVPDADAVFEEFVLEQFTHQDRLDPLGLGGVVGRMNEMAQKLSLVVACSQNIYEPAVTKEVALWCVDYARFSFLRMAEAAEKNIGSGEHGKARKQLLQFVIEKGARGATERDIGRKFKNTPPKVRGIALRDLEIAEEIILTKQKTGGRPRIAYVAVGD